MIRRRNTPKVSSEHKQLIELARGYAESMMRDAGSVRPALLADTEDGIIFYLPESMGDERAKQNFANTARLIVVAYRAAAVAFVMESWARFARPGRPLDSTPPSQSPDRKECVVISVETRNRQTTKMLMISRDDAGVFVGFTLPDIPDITAFKGRFAEIMPPKAPVENNVTVARQLLQFMGVEPENQGFNPMWN